MLIEPVVDASAPSVAMPPAPLVPLVLAEPPLPA